MGHGDVARDAGTDWPFLPMKEMADGPPIRVVTSMLVMGGSHSLTPRPSGAITSV